MCFRTLRAELHHCSSLSEIICFLTEHVNELCATYDCAPPIELSYSQFRSQGPVWTFLLWFRGNSEYCEGFDRVLAALGFWIQWTASSADPRHGSDACVTMIKREWPVMQVCERFQL
jgi:hypothetical protein